MFMEETLSFHNAFLHQGLYKGVHVLGMSDEILQRNLAKDWYPIQGESSDTPDVFMLWKPG